MLKQLALAGVFVLVAGTLNAQSTATATPAPTTHAAATTSSNKKHEPSKQEVTMAQQSLTKAGLYKGKVDEETLKKLEPPAPATAPASP